MSLFFPFIAISSVRHPTGSNGRSAKKKRIIFRLVEKRYHRCHSVCLLQLFHTRGSSEAQEKRNQLFGTAHNLLTHFEWANADEEVFMCLLKEVSVIVARRVLFKRIIFRCQLPQNKKKETNTEQCRLQSSLAVEHRRKHLKNCYAPHLLEVDYMKYLLFSQQCTFSSPSQHSLRILSSLLPFKKNLPCIRRPNSCTVLWQQLICWLVLLPSLSMLLIGCPWFRNTGAIVDMHLTQPTSRALHRF